MAFLRASVELGVSVIIVASRLVHHRDTKIHKGTEKFPTMPAKTSAAFVPAAAGAGQRTCRRCEGKAFPFLSSGSYRSRFQPDHLRSWDAGTHAHLSPDRQSTAL